MAVAVMAQQELQVSAAVAAAVVHIKKY